MRTDAQRRAAVDYLNRNPEQREKARVRARAHALKTRMKDEKFRRRLAYYQELVELQGGETCRICGFKPENRRLHVDHDHATGEIRGLLCLHCNTMLGRFSDSIERFRAAIEYLSQTHYTGRSFAEWEGLSVAYLYGGTRTNPTEPQKSQNFSKGDAVGGAGRSVAGSSTAVLSGESHRTTPTESGEPVDRIVGDSQASEPVALHPSDLVLGEQGVGQESVVGEHGVVEARHAIEATP